MIGPGSDKNKVLVCRPPLLLTTRAVQCEPLCFQELARSLPIMYHHHHHHFYHIRHRHLHRHRHRHRHRHHSDHFLIVGLCEPGSICSQSLRGPPETSDYNGSKLRGIYNQDLFSKFYNQDLF